MITLASKVGPLQSAIPNGHDNSFIIENADAITRRSGVPHGHLCNESRTFWGSGRLLIKSRRGSQAGPDTMQEADKSIPRHIAKTVRGYVSHTPASIKARLPADNQTSQ